MILLNNISLGDMRWINEFDFVPSQVSITRTISGALLVERATKIKGRQFTIAGGESYGWITRATLLEIYALLSSSSMPLVINDQTFNVIFDEQSPIVATPVIEYESPESTDSFFCKFQLLEI